MFRKRFIDKLYEYISNCIFAVFREPRLVFYLLVTFDLRLIDWCGDAAESEYLEIMCRKGRTFVNHMSQRQNL